MNLDELTADLGEAHAFKKEYSDELEKLRGDFFDEATQACKAKPLARKTAQVVGTQGLEEAEARHLIERKNPGWTVLEVEPDKDGWKAILEEDPEFSDFVHINRVDGKVYRRQRVDGTIVLDDEMCQESDPDLWYEITRLQGHDELAELLYHANVDHTEIDSRLDDWAEAYNWPRIVRPIEEWSSDQIKRADRYLYQKPPALKLAAPRKAKPEELEAE